MSKPTVHRLRKMLIRWLAAVIAVSLTLPFMPQSAAQAASPPVVPLQFSAPEVIGPMVTSPSASDAVFGVEDGRQVMYTAVTGDPAFFNVVDMQDYRLIRSVEMPGGGGTSAHVIDSKGQVYTGTKNGLYRYSPVTKQVVRLAGVEGAAALYGFAIDEHDNVYGGTYPLGSVFKYEPATDKLTVFDRLSAGKEYVRSIEYYKGSLYAGTGAVGELYRVNPNDGSKEVIPLPNVEMYTEQPAAQLYSMSIVRNYMFILTSAHNLLLYDLESRSWLPEWSSEENLARYYRGMYVSPESDGKVYLGMEGKIHTFDLETREFAPTGIEFSTYLRKPGWVEMNDPELPGKSLATVLSNGGAAVLNFTTNVVKTLDPVVPGQPVSIQSLEFGPGGLLYSAGYLGAYGARYNILTGEKELFPIGQSEGMTPYGGKMLFGVYPAATIHELDPSLPIERGVNPKQIHQIQDQQDRPFAMTSKDNLLFIGTVPKLGELGGALTIYDGSTWETYRNVVQNQSIMGLAYREGAVKGEGLLYGSTSVWGGLGIEPSEPEAKMFVWDVKTKQVIKEFTPAIEQSGGVKARTIGALSFGPDGLLWGASYGTVFAMNPDTYEIMKQKEIHPTNWDFSHSWVPAKLRWGADGFLYTTLGSTVTVIDPATMAHLTIPGTKTNLMVVGHDGNIYYNEAADLKRITVTPGQPPAYADVEIPIVNGSFEQVNHDGTIPGWVQHASKSDVAEYLVSDERASDGSRSLKLMDQSGSTETGVLSVPFPVQPGLEYTAQSNIFLAEGRTIFALKYYDAEDKEIKLTPAPANYFQSPRGRWTAAEFNSIAPEGAVTARLFIFCSTAWTGTSYFDNVRIFEKRSYESPTDGDIVQHLDVPNAGFEQPLTENGAIPGWKVRDPQLLTGKNASISLSSETARSGQNSLYLYDNETALAVAVDSDLIPAEAGRTYTVSMDVYRTSPPAGRSSNRPTMQIRYHDNTGKEMAVVPGVTMSKEITSSINTWANESFTSKAPAGASYLRVIVIGAGAWVASVYVDNVDVTTIMPAENKTSLSLIRTAAPSLAAGENATFTVTANSGAEIIVREGLETVAQAVGAGDDSPVIVTIPSPAAGTHLYEVYADNPGLGRSDAIPLTPVTVYAPTGYEIHAEEEITLKVGEAYSVYAKGTYGPLTKDVTDSLTMHSLSSEVAALSGNVITGAKQGQTVVEISLGGETVQLHVTVMDEVKVQAARLSGPASAQGGSSFDLIYGLANVTSSVYAKEMTVHYDPSQLSYTGSTSLIDGFGVIMDSQKPGIVRILEAGTGISEGITGSMDLLKLHFQALPTAPSVTSSVYLTDVIVADGFGNETVLDGGPAHMITITVDEAALQAAVEEAEALAADAPIHPTRWGHYTPASLEALQAAIAGARSVMDDGSASQLQVNEAAAAMAAALAAFNSSVNTEAHIGDLAIMAAHYGTTSENADWAVVHMYDVDKNGELGIIDLVSLARLILDTE